MREKRYYRCPDCDHVLDHRKYPSGESCPHCVKAARVWGRARARGEIRPGEELKLKPDGPHALDISVYRISHYFHAIGIAVLIPAIFFLAMPLLFSARTEPAFVKVQYLAGYQQELESAAARAEEEKISAIYQLGCCPRRSHPVYHQLLAFRGVPGGKQERLTSLFCGAFRSSHHPPLRFPK